MSAPTALPLAAHFSVATEAPSQSSGGGAQGAAAYAWSCLNRLLWNLLNIAIAVGLVRRPGRPVEQAWR